ncbi:MAG: cation:proton antiporter [Methanomassiliicoccaceae archaeon]|jgi:Kef-type K+ transport system membrane component KefB|nr:cation:proton antiporter [Methanomassiliicoccaceae archaeon]
MAAEFEMGQLMIILSVLFILAISASAIFKRFGIPGLIGEILIGVFVANLVIGDWSLLGALDIVLPVPGVDDGNTYWNMLEVLAELGVVFLLFTVGLETKVKDLTSVGRTAMLVATLGVIIPFVLGYAVITLWDGNVYHAMFMGAAMVATSVGITAQVIKDMKVLNRPESRIIIAAAVIDDILGLIVLAVVAGMARTGSIDMFGLAEMIIVSVMFVIIVILFCSKGVPRIAGKIRRTAEGKNKKRSGVDIFVVALSVCLLLSALAAQMKLAMIVGAFLAGMIFADHAKEYGLEKKMGSVTAFLLPFFFISVGMRVDLSSLKEEFLLLAAVIIILAILSKYIGCGLGTMIGDRKKESSANIVGIGMIPRGEVGIIVAMIGIKIIADGGPVMSGDLFTIVVLMSVVTTIIAPFMLSRVFKKKYGNTQEDAASE